MNRRTPILFIEDIIEAIEKIEEFTKNMSMEEFKNDDKTTSAVLRKLEVIGEATKNIPANLKGKHPEIPWKRMAGLRDIVIHEYFGIDITIIWKIINENLPRTKPLLRKLLEEGG